MEKFGIETFVYRFVKSMASSLRAVSDQITAYGVDKLIYATESSVSNPSGFFLHGTSLVICMCCLPSVVITIKAIRNGRTGTNGFPYYEALYTVTHTVLGIAMNTRLTFPTLLLVGIPITLLDVCAFMTMNLIRAERPNYACDAFFPALRIFVTLTAINICNVLP